MGTRQAEHADDKKAFPDKHNVVSSTDGGACLTGHESGRNEATGKVNESSCNYRWQAFRRALDADSERYNWPRYKSLSESDSLFTRLRFGLRKMKPPDEKSKSWDVTEAGMNFRSSCNVPYWHESHHIVPNGELRDSIEAVGEGGLAEEYRKLIREGLLDEKYNLNFMNNMVILPMDRKVAKAIQLPRHRHTHGHRSHKAYSKYVRLKLDDIFGKIRDKENEHLQMPDYKACKTKLLRLSAKLRKEIFAAGGSGSLDQVFKKLSKPALP